MKTAIATLTTAWDSPLKLAKETAIILSASLLIALSAQIEIPGWPVPITGQTFGVLLIASILGRVRGTIAVAAYLIEGLAGLPFFAGGAAGLLHFAGPTGGYLLGFLPAAFIAGSIAGRTKSLTFILLGLTAATMVIFATGIFWLSAYTGWTTLMSMGLIPFIPGAAIKIALAGMCVKALKK